MHPQLPRRPTRPHPRDPAQRVLDGDARAHQPHTGQRGHDLHLARQLLGVIPVIRVQLGEQGAFRQVQPRLPRRGPTLILCQAHQPNAWVSRRRYRLLGVVGRSVVHHNAFPVAEGLRQQRSQRPRQRLRRVVTRHHHRHLRPGPHRVLNRLAMPAAPRSPAYTRSSPSSQPASLARKNSHPSLRRIGSRGIA